MAAHWVPIGHVKGEDGKVSQVNTVYVNDGGDPDVKAELSGPSTSMTLTLTFSNLVRDQLTESELDQILNNLTVNTSNVVTGTRLSTFWSGLWEKLNEKFSPKKHAHDAADIESGTLDPARIADGTITKDMLEKTLGDSISRSEFSNCKKTEFRFPAADDQGVIRLTSSSGKKVSLSISDDLKVYVQAVSATGETKGRFLA